MRNDLFPSFLPLVCRAGSFSHEAKEMHIIGKNPVGFLALLLRRLVVFFLQANRVYIKQSSVAPKEFSELPQYPTRQPLPC